MPRSFDQYADDEGLTTPPLASRFFLRNPDILDEVIALRQRTPPETWVAIHAWLREEHDYGPVESKTVKNYVVKTGRA